MAGEWKTGTLSDIAEVVMGHSPPGETCHADAVGDPLLNGPTEFGPYHPVPVQFTTDPKRHAQEGDILFCVRGSTTGRMNWADQRYAIGRGLAAIRHKKGKGYRYFLKAVVDHNLPDLLAAATGSTFPCVSRDQILGMDVELPPPADQRAVARVLGALDDKIELNRRMNQTLEGLARAVFRSWFVDFDPVVAKAAGRRPVGMTAATAALFPNSFADSPLGPIPKGWEVRPLIELMELHRGYDLPTRDRVAGSIPIISSSGVSGWHQTSAVKGPGIVTGRYGTIGEVYFADDDFWPLNTTLYVSDSKGNPLRFLFHLLEQVDFAQFTDKAAVPGVNRNDIHRSSVVAPPLKLRSRFEAHVGPLWHRYSAGSAQSSTLAALRDALLPQLLSGELRLRDAEKCAANA